MGSVRHLGRMIAMKEMGKRLGSQGLEWLRGLASEM
jgi:hypothetical protein